MRAQLPAGEPARFLQKYIGLTAAQLEQARRGAVITRVLDTPDPDEVAIFGIVAIDVARATIAARMRDVPTFPRSATRPAFGVFGTPATAGDARGFSAEQSDLDALEGCRPGDCDVKMPVPLFDGVLRTFD